MVMRALVAVVIMLPVLIPARSHAQSAIVVDALLTELQRTLVRVHDTRDDVDLPALSKVTVNLKSALKTNSDGKVSLFVVEFGSSVAKESVLEIRLDLRPPRDSDPSPVSSAGDLLADAIIQSATAVMHATRGIPPLHLNKLTASIRFVVESDTGGNAGFKILPVTVELGANVESQTSQELIVEFGG